MDMITELNKLRKGQIGLVSFVRKAQKTGWTVKIFPNGDVKLDKNG